MRMGWLGPEGVCPRLKPCSGGCTNTLIWRGECHIGLGPCTVNFEVWPRRHWWMRPPNWFPWKPKWLRTLVNFGSLHLSGVQRVTEKVLITYSMVYLGIDVTRQFSTYLQWRLTLSHWKIWTICVCVEFADFKRNSSRNVSLYSMWKIWMNWRGQKTYISFIFCTEAGDEIFGNFISITPLHFYLLKASWELAREVWWRDMKKSQLQLKSFPHWNAHRGKYNNWP